MTGKFGSIVYFFARWMPGRQFRLPGWTRKLTRGNEIRRLRAAAAQMGNPYRYVQLGDGLRDVGQYEGARAAYLKALEKEPDNTAALWGAGRTEMRLKLYEAARAHLEHVLKIDPNYKFGDVSLAYGRVLVSLNRTEEALAHLEIHSKRWREPEGSFLLAQLYADAGRTEEARRQLEMMRIDIESCPRAIARKHGKWIRLARRLQQKLPSAP